MTNYLALRVNIKLKEAFFLFCKKKGLSVSIVITMFVQHFIKNGLPFSLLELDDNMEFTEGKTTRISLCLDNDIRKDFSAACVVLGIPMSVIIRSFMFYCVSNNAFPKM